MRERPILFSAPMVRAILEGRKTQTRRIVKGAPDAPDYRPVPIESPYWSFTPTSDYGSSTDVKCPYGAPGDRLWVREAFTWITGNGIRPHYRADGEPTDREGNVLPTDPGERRWMPSIHMPRKVSRITLDVAAVRVERLFDISEFDAKAEGVYGPHHGRWTDGDGRTVPPENEPPRCWAHSFFVAWREINGNDLLWANPWVWVVEFRRVEAARAEAAA